MNRFKEGDSVKVTGDLPRAGQLDTVQSEFLVGTLTASNTVIG